jgi:Family of unknown function (DUF6204)
MSLHIFRVTASGQFHALDDERRATLLAEAADHVVARAEFTRTGTFTNEVPLVSFSFRYETRVDDDEAADPAAEAADRAREQAIASLDGRGIHYRHLRIQATDMADMWRNR